ncbi:hypothetical protein [Okeania sp. SIO1I7]|uniref:hypothetical protein n=1 Tax=Okeania sp. SIO1I7 TaxID=2607772 RepID=UPI0013F6FD77|nr:hypothetical protein [Okeania sp. SIO1I7]NET26174.1 hypothetical protein [Okeania sp. SIO1I7]
MQTKFCHNNFSSIYVMAEGRRKKEEERRKKEEGRRKEEGKILRCLSFKLSICPNLFFDSFHSQLYILISKLGLIPLYSTNLSKPKKTWQKEEGRINKEEGRKKEEGRRKEEGRKKEKSYVF